MSFERKIIILKDIENAHKRISKHVEYTPVIQNQSFNEKYGRNFFFKCENMQRTGSFKLRGAINATQQLIERNGEVKGLVTHSSGNHGQAVALAAKIFNLKCTIVCPETSPKAKQNAIKNFGAELVLCEPSIEGRVSASKKIEEEKGYHYLSSCDDYDIITGQGTIGLEFLKQVPELDAILVAACGGGMSAGTCIAGKALQPRLKVFIAEPQGKDLEKCLKAGERLWPNPPRYLDTVADGLRQQQLGLRNWPIILDMAEKEVFSMTDEETILGMKEAFETLKVVVEPSAGTTIAAAMSSKLKNMDPDLKNIGVILCGGNVDMERLPWLHKIS